MIKVFLVEDEKIVREGIKKEIPWGKYDMELVGEASDGELAFPLIQQTRPDILLTDIRMPFMDGLELAELVKKEMPDIRIMFFSGYDDFEYAKKAIHIGASDYLLKPISSAQLLAALEQMSEQIVQLRNEKEYREQFRQEQEEQRLWERERLFDEIMRGSSSMSEVFQKARSFGIDLTAAAYTVVLFGLKRPAAQDSQGQPADSFYEQLKLCASQNNYAIGFDRMLEGMAYIVKADTETELGKITEEWLEQIRVLAVGRGVTEYFGAVGMPVVRFSEIRNSYRTACKAYAYRYLSDESRFLHYDQIKQDQKEDHSSGMDLTMLDVTGVDKSVLEDFFKTSMKEEEDFFIEDYIMSFGKNINSLMFRQYILMDIYVVTRRYMKQIGVSDEVVEQSLPGIDQMMQKNSDAVSFSTTVRELLRQALRLRETASQRRYRQLLDHARDFINKNYHNQEMSLGMVAAQVNLSPAHFSTVFSQEMEVTFVEYLTSVRMGQAKHLLKSTDLRTSEIAYRIGYKDPHYFSYLFKKTQRMTPKAYRGGQP
ncbi:MAG: response regulator [Lachnospiraceae bacterium]